jgi:hypothetical protein
LLTAFVVQEDQECNFQPELSPVSEIIMATKKEWQAEETADEKFHRLSALDADRQRAARSEQEQQYYGQFTFRPAINPQSHRMAQVNKESCMIQGESNFGT